MKKNEFKGFLIIAVIIVVFIVIIAGVRNKKKNKENDTGTQTAQTTQTAQNTAKKEEFVKVQDDGTKINTSSKLAETKKLDGLEISDVKLSERSGESYVKATVKNTTNETKGDKFITLTVVDKKGDTLVTLHGYLNTMKAGESTELSIKASADFANAYDFKVSY